MVGFLCKAGLGLSKGTDHHLVTKVITHARTAESRVGPGAGLSRVLLPSKLQDTLLQEGRDPWAPPGGLDLLVITCSDLATQDGTGSGYRPPERCLSQDGVLAVSGQDPHPSNQGILEPER